MTGASPTSRDRPSSNPGQAFLYHTVNRTVMTVSRFQNDGLDRQFTASSVKPYFERPYRQIVIAQP
jgi:hypothetical protein